MLRICFTMLLSLGFSGKVLAWGAEGHQAVAWIAESELTPKAAEAVHQLLALEGKHHLSEVSSWADGIRGSKPGLTAHSVRIRFQDDKYDPNKVCRKVGRCVVYGVQNSKQILLDANSSADEKLIALKLLVHFVGDIHQPLHAIKQTGSFNVTIGRRQTTLHTLWDRSVRYMKVPPVVLAQQLMSESTPIVQGDAPMWAEESHRIAKYEIYKNNIKIAQGLEPITIPRNYIQIISPTVRNQIKLAGVRLGQELNQIFDGQQPPPFPLKK